jgi:hypothetical protein
MLETLDQLICFINNEYLKINKEWGNSIYYKKINLKKNIVSNIYNKKEILDEIFNYRKFINERNIEIIKNIKKLKIENNIITARAKTQNSIEYKIKKYNSEEKYNYGKEPINKCLNDLFGIRIILSNYIEYRDIETFAEKNYQQLKCINAAKQEYIATHIYFKENNYIFPWELQIWCKDKEKSNINSHAKYKQDYTKWEKENKRRGIN